MPKKEYTSVEVANEVLKKALEVYKDHIKKSESSPKLEDKVEDKSNDPSKLEDFVKGK